MCSSFLSTISGQDILRSGKYLAGYTRGECRKASSDFKQMVTSTQISVKLLSTEFNENPFSGFQVALSVQMERWAGQADYFKLDNGHSKFHKMQEMSILAEVLLASQERLRSVKLGRRLVWQAYIKFRLQCPFLTVLLSYKRSGQILFFHITHETRNN